MSNIHEIIDRIISYGTPAVLLIKGLIEKLAGNPDFQAKATEEIMKVVRGGKTRTDDLLFFASLIFLSGPDAIKDNKILFYKKFYELTNPELSGKTPEEEKELLRKKDLANGFVLLLAEDTTADEKGVKKFIFAKQVWYGLFMGISDLPDDASKLEALEKRILLFGENHKEGNLILKEFKRFDEKCGEWAAEIETYTESKTKHAGYLRGIFGNRVGCVLEKIFLS